HRVFGDWSPVRNRNGSSVTEVVNPPTFRVHLGNVKLDGTTSTLMDNFPRGRPPRGPALSPVESHLLQTMGRVARYPVRGEPDVLVHTGRFWKTRRTIERDFALELDSRGNAKVRHEVTES